VRAALIAPLLAWSLWGCQQAEMEATRVSLDDLNRRIDALNRDLKDSRSEIEALRAEDAAERTDLTSQLEELSAGLRALPEVIEPLCTDASPPPPVACKETPVRERVVVSNDKMLVGELENVFIDPPGVYVVARMDTGATSSSLNAEELVPFERDGEDWIRFNMILPKNESVTLERRIIRFARVIQQADPKGSRRPVVAMRVRLGEVQDTFEFTLADRSHLENEIILGRNFLADVTLVDVGRQFIQPRHKRQ
jgi:outer membrane murein-binding lipoprotein Lpp